MARPARWLLAVIIPVLLLPTLYTVLRQAGPLWDEGSYHLPAIERFGPGLPSLEVLRDYNSAVGPLFYVVLANVGALAGNRLPVLRLAVFLLAAINVLLFWLLGRRLVPGGRFSPLLLLVSYPYFFSLSGLLMSEHLALCFGLLALLGYLRWTEDDAPWALAGSLVAASAAVLTRQFYAFLPVGLAIAEFLRSRGRGRMRAILPLLSLLPLAGLVLLWRGMVPPSFQGVYAPGFTPGTASSVLAWTGLFFLPFLFARLARQRFRLSPWLLLALPAVPCALVFPPDGIGLTRTIVHRLPGSLPAIAGAVLALLGAAHLVMLGQRLAGADAARRAPAIIGLAVLLVLLASGTPVFERYFLPAFVFLLLFELPDTRGWWPLAWSLGIQLPLAVVQLLRLAPVTG